MRVKDGNKTKTRKGGWCHLAPHGYLNNIAEKTVEIDPDRFYIIRKLWELAIEGKYSLKQICDIANDDLGFKTRIKHKRGGVPMSKSSLSKIFNNPFYYGKIKNGENQNMGNHKPMVSYLEFQKVQAYLKRHGHKSITSTGFPYIGIFQCGKCSSSITAESKVKYKCPNCGRKQSAKHPKVCSCGYHLDSSKIPNVKHYTYYHCSNSYKKCVKKCLKEELIENGIFKFLEKYQIDAQFITWAESWFIFIEKQLIDDKNKLQENQKTKLDQLKAQKDRLLDLRLNQEIDEKVFKEKQTTLNHQIESTSNTLNKDKEALDSLKESLTVIEGLIDKFEKYSPRERKSLLHKISSNPKMTDEEVHIEAKKQYFYIPHLRKHKSLRIEPSKDGLVSSLNTEQKECYTIWLATLDEFRTL